MIFPEEGRAEAEAQYRAIFAGEVLERAYESVVRRECLDHLLVLGEAQLRRVLREYVQYFNHARPHQGLAQRIPIAPGEVAGHAIAGGSVRAIPILGGLHHAYAKTA